MKRFLSILLNVLCVFYAEAQGLSESQVTEVMNSAFEQHKAGNYLQALDYFIVVGQNTRTQRTELESQVYVCSQTMAVMCYEALGKYGEGFMLCDTLLKGRLTEREKKDLLHLYVANGYFLSLHYMQSASRRFEEARAILEKILPFADAEMRARILPRVPLTWYFEGTLYHTQQKYDEALACLEKARKGFHEVGDNRNETDAIYQIGEIKSAIYDIVGALDSFRQAELLARGDGQVEMLLKTMMEQRRLYKLIGESDRMAQLTLQIEALVTAIGDDKAKIVHNNYLGDEARELGRLDLAEQWYLRNRDYIEQLEDDYVGVDRYLYYVKLRELYIRMEKYDEAMRYAQLSKKEFQKGSESTDADYYIPYISIADIYRRKGDSIRCFQYLDTLFCSMDRFVEPRWKASLYTTRAGCYFSFKNYEQALWDYRTADSILTACCGDNDGDRVVLLPLMGGTENRLGHYNESEKLYREYEKRIKALQGENGIEYVNALYYLANAEAFAGYIDEACSDYSLAVNKMRNLTRYRLPYMTVAEKESYWNTSSELFRSMTSFVLKAEKQQSSFVIDCYEGLILTKAFLLETERSMYNLVKAKGKEADLKEYATIASMRAKILDLERNYSENADSILLLTSKADALESRLVSRCRAYGDMTDFMEIGYRKIQKKLNVGDVLIDFVDIESESQGRVYAAYIVDNQQEYPILKLLFAEKKIDSLQIAYPDMFYEGFVAEELYKIIWKPLEKYVEEGATVYYVPTQMMFQIALESIPLEDGSLLGEHFHFVRLSSARELVRYKARLDIDISSTGIDAVLYGGLIYGLDPSDTVARVDTNYVAQAMMMQRGNMRRGDSLFGELPGSGREVDSIGQILTLGQLRVEFRKGKTGTEESFMSMHGDAPVLLHLATHGFFYTPDSAQKIEYLKGYKDAMSLSGLVLAGGNAAWRGQELPEGRLDGILTAANIANIDLSNIQLVVVSACRSGQGKATPEGLYGLQRAFKKAGVKTMMMSLWDVDDAVGTEFMMAFYKNLVDKDGHWDKYAAFEKARKSVRENHPEPFYWAGFIMLD